LAKAAEIHKEAITLDTHVDIPGARYATEDIDPGAEGSRLRCTLPKMEKGSLDGVFLAVYVGQRGKLNEDGFTAAKESALAKFEAIHRLAKSMYPERCTLVTSTEELTKVLPTGKRAIMIGIENGYPVGEDLGLLKTYYDLGARYITLSHSGHNQICDSSGPEEPLHGGLTDFGRDVVKEMNRLGIIVDVSHISVDSFWNVLETSTAPVIASHSGCYALNEHDRNLTDEQLKALAEKGGVVQIVALSGFLKNQPPERREAVMALREELGYRWISSERFKEMTDEEKAEYQALRDTYEERMKVIDEQFPPADLSVFVNHIDHAVQVAGIDHVGIGTDFDGGGGIPGFNDHSECLNVTIELLRRGYTEEDIQKIWGGNLLRVWREVEDVADSKSL
jgi:microsomal dipeptidase-like Zn-dependent dipeptidase